VPPGILFLPNVLVNLTAIVPIFNFNAILGRGPWYYALRFTWAIFVEFVFYYGVFAALVGSAAGAALGRLRGTPGHNDRLALWTWLAIAGTGVLWAIDAFVRPLHHAVQFTPYFLLGLALWRASEVPAPRTKALAGLAAVISILHCACYVAGKPLGLEGLMVATTRPAALTATAVFALVCGAIALLASRTAGSRWRNRDRVLGDLSYPLYLNHYVLIILSASVLPVHDGWGQAALLGVALGLAAVMHRLVEAPLVGMRNRMRRQAL
jgi:peptidoglycan/LPS O-acetylase OafA/YrhL